MGVNYCGHGVGGVMEAVYELKAQGNQQCEYQEKVRHD